MRAGWLVSMTALLLLLPSGGAFAQNSYYLPQIANGTSGGTTFRTTFVFFNNTDNPAAAQLKLTADDGSPLPVQLDTLGAGSEFTIFLSPGATRMLQTDGKGALVAGAATVSSPVKIGVTAIFTVYDGDGNFVAEAGVGSSEPLTDFVLPVDSRGLFSTGLALFNGGAGTAVVTLSLRDPAGRPAGQTIVTLTGLAHLARFVTGSGQLFPSLGDFQGTLRVQCSAPVAALVLRQYQTPLTYTSLPVVPASSTRLSQNLAQVADGSFADGSFRTSFLFFNLSAGSADIVLTLTRDDGSPFPVTIPGRGTGSTFNLSLPAGASAFLQTDGTGPLTAGAATITSTAPVGASAIFTVYDPGGTFETEAGVGDSAVSSAMTLPVDIGALSDTGVAFFNPGPVHATVTVRLLDGGGALLGSGTTIELPPRNHSARFITQIFPGIRDFRGSMSIASTAAIAALTLRQNSSPLSYTTLPVATGFASGISLEVPLLSKTQGGITATADVTVNETLPFGFRLTGTVSGTGRALQVTARRADGTYFNGEIDRDTGRYLVALGQGTYTLQVCFQPVSAASWGSVTVTYSDPAPVQLSGDLKRDISLPSVPLHEVSGTVSGVSGLPETADARLVFTSEDGTIEGSFILFSDGRYQGFLPSGGYRGSVSVPLVVFSPFQNQALAIYNLGTASVAGGPVSPSLSIPAAARVSGTIRAPWLGPLAFGLRVSASDRSAPPVADPACIVSPGVSSANPDPGTQQYQMVLARNRSYSMSLSAPLLDNGRRLGAISFPLAPDGLDLADNVTYDFNIPDLTGRVTLSGLVTDGNGRRLEGVLVAAFTQSLTGAPNIGYAASSLTDSQGAYSLTLLSGTGYQLQFIPPIPAPLGGGWVSPAPLPPAVP